MERIFPIVEYGRKHRLFEKFPDFWNLNRVHGRPKDSPETTDGCVPAPPPSIIIRIALARGNSRHREIMERKRNFDRIVSRDRAFVSKIASQDPVSKKRRRLVL
jgi:hypothetical protein